MTEFKNFDFSNKTILKDWYEGKTGEDICKDITFDKDSIKNVTYLYIFVSQSGKITSTIYGFVSLLLGSAIWPIITNLFGKYWNFVERGRRNDDFTLVPPYTQGSINIKGYMSISTQINIMIMAVLSMFLIYLVVRYIGELRPKKKKKEFIKQYIDLFKSA